MTHKKRETPPRGSESVSGQTSAPVVGADNSTSLLPLQLTPEDLEADRRAREHSKRLLKRIIEAADGAPESYRSRL